MRNVTSKLSLATRVDKLLSSPGIDTGTNKNDGSNNMVQTGRQWPTLIFLSGA